MVSRELIAAVLGVGFGLFLVAFPAAFIRSWTAGRGTPDTDTPYGQDATPSEKWQWIVRAVGLIAIVGGLAFGASILL